MWKMFLVFPFPFVEIVEKLFKAASTKVFKLQDFINF